MFKIVWILNLVCLLIALGTALFGSGQDAPGRGVLWFIVALFAVAAAASWWLDHSGSTTLATAIAILGCVVGVIGAGLFARSLTSERSAATGSAYWNDPVQRQLAVAIADGDTAAMRAAVSAGANPNAEGADNTTPLLFAIRTRPTMVGALVKFGANPNQERTDVVSPLEAALTAVDPAFQQLLDGGANPNRVDMYGTPILFTVIREGLYARYDMLVQHGADVHARDGKGHTSLMAAVEARQWNVALDLLKRGVDASIVGTDGATIATMIERAQSTHRDNPEFQQVLTAIRKS